MTKQWTSTSSGTFVGELEREVVGEGATPVTKQWTTSSGTFAGELEREVVEEGGSYVRHHFGCNACDKTVDLILCPAPFWLRRL